MQFDPITAMLKAPETKRLKLKYDQPLQNFAFNFNFCYYIEVLLEHGADVDRPDKQGVTAVQTAAESGHHECLRLLLEAGAYTRSHFSST